MELCQYDLFTRALVSLDQDVVVSLLDNYATCHWAQVVLYVYVYCQGQGTIMSTSTRL